MDQAGVAIFIVTYALISVRRIAAFGLVPLLFATGPGSEIQRPLAVVVIGGLVTSTALTLLILPLLYLRFGGRAVSPALPVRETSR